MIRPDHLPVESYAADYQAWPYPVFLYESVDSALLEGFRGDGVHRVRIGVETLDFLLVGTERYAHADYALVVFAGAVTNRNGKKAPFFAGRGIANRLKLPLISISDPTLARSDQISIGWYAGNDVVGDLAPVTARLLSGIAERTGRRFIMVGGSGGGFATLSCLMHLDSVAIGCVWNPQTVISEYDLRFVAEYVRVAFPDSKYHTQGTYLDDAGKARAEIRREFQRIGVCESVLDWSPACSESKVIYLQNLTDWHVRKHAAPFVSRRIWQRIGDGAFVDREKAVAFGFVNWGKGHVAPSESILVDLLTRAIRGDRVEEVAVFASASVGSYVDMVSSENKSIELRAGRLRGNEVSASFENSNCDDMRLEYAFYLMSNGKRLGVRWYGSNSNAKFDCPADVSEIHVIGFARDRHGFVLRKRVTVS